MERFLAISCYMCLYPNRQYSIMWENLTTIWFASRFLEVSVPVVIVIVSLMMSTGIQSLNQNQQLNKSVRLRGDALSSNLRTVHMFEMQTLFRIAREPFKTIVGSDSHKKSKIKLNAEESNHSNNSSADLMLKVCCNIKGETHWVTTTMLPWASWTY